MSEIGDEVRAVLDGPAPKKRINTSAKGRAHEKEVAAILEAQGYMVERARALYVWLKGGPMAVRHDFFSCIDVIAVKADEVRFIQVTEWEEVSKKVKKIKAAGFPARCEIWGRFPGRNAHYRVLQSVANFGWGGSIEMVIRK